MRRTGFTLVELLVAICIIGILAGLLLGDEDDAKEMPEAVAAYLDYSAKQRSMAISSLEKSVADLKPRVAKAKRGRITGQNATNPSNGNRTYSSKQTKTADVEALQKKLDAAASELADAKNPEVLWVPSIDLRNPVIDGVGKLISRGVAGARNDGRSNIQLKVVSIADDQNMLVRWGQSGFWFTGHPTAELADGMYISLHDMYWVRGTKQYESTDGAQRTVIHLQKFDPEEARPFLPKRE